MIDVKSKAKLAAANKISCIEAYAVGKVGKPASNQ
jgi:hypothetical protein